MKKVLIVFAHPKQDSLNHALLERYANGLRKAKHQVRIIDLYTEKFDPVYRLEKPDSIVKRYQKLILWSDHITFIFPVWWGSFPAMLKGWFDRVLLARFAYRFGKQGLSVGLLQSRTAFVIKTHGGRAVLTKLFMGNTAWKTLKKNVFRVCGLKCLGHLSCWRADMISGQKQIPKYLDKAEELGENQFK